MRRLGGSGRAAEEMEVIEGLLQAYSATPSEVHEIRTFARTPRSIDEVPLTELSAADRRMLLHQAVLLTFVDGEQAESELQVLAALAEKLRIPAQEVDAILTSGAAHAKSMLHLLQTN
ncbi:MAG: hypothetical protein QM784_11900 [Polyangiaceae bacterium]